MNEQRMAVIPFLFERDLSPDNFCAQIYASDNIRVQIHSPMAVYLAQTGSRELFEYLRSKAAEIELFVGEIERRLKRGEQ